MGNWYPIHTIHNWRFNWNYINFLYFKILKKYDKILIVIMKQTFKKILIEIDKLPVLDKKSLLKINTYQLDVLSKINKKKKSYNIKTLKV